jgi:hypothetical protein
MLNFDEEVTPEDADSLDNDLVYACDFCGEMNAVSFDATAFVHARRQQFTEDCAVCCRPNLLTVEIDRDGFVSLEVEREYDA